MKYQLLFLIILMLVHLSCSREHSDQSAKHVAPQAENGTTLSLGMSHQTALEIIRECGGQDITSRLAVVGPNNEWPLSDLYWNLEQYDAILKINAADGKLVEISYWTGADFSKNKTHREESRKSLKSLTFEKQSKTLRTEAL